MTVRTASAVFSREDVAFARQAIDFHPDESPFWDSQQGQDALHIARSLRMLPKTTNASRRELYRGAKLDALFKVQP